jgi:hypothetical protein
MSAVPRKRRSAGQFWPVHHLLQSLCPLRRGCLEWIMNALAATHDAAVQMIDTSIIRVHQHAACIARNKRQSSCRNSLRQARGQLPCLRPACVDPTMVAR